MPRPVSYIFLMLSTLTCVSFTINTRLVQKLVVVVNEYFTILGRAEIGLRAESKLSKTNTLKRCGISSPRAGRILPTRWAHPRILALLRIRYIFAYATASGRRRVSPDVSAAMLVRLRIEQIISFQHFMFRTLSDSYCLGSRASSTAMKTS